VAELEASLTVLRNSVEPLERENERLREQIKEYRQKLENSAQSSEAKLEKIRDRILLTHPPKERRKLKTILDQFISQCAT
jgi:predicted  nucleic acid-binding Zn-ribbon protein